LLFLHDPVGTVMAAGIARDAAIGENRLGLPPTIWMDR
jgi:hypothetical protein